MTAMLETPKAVTEAAPIEPSTITPSLRFKWDIALGILVIHLGALFAPATFTWNAFWLFVALQFVTGLGVTVGFHRLLTHRSFQTPKWVEYVLTLCGSLSLQGGVIKWVATHRVHHAFSDRAQDPHSPLRKGFWWAHVFWLFAYDEVLDHPIRYRRYAPELAKDPVHLFLHKTHLLQTILLSLALYAWGGWSFVVWGVFVRTAFVYHGTWLVNSAAHIWGYQSYQTNEGSRNNWWVAVISYGEGWHNNHHAYPSSAAHGLRWWEFDLTYLTIRMLGLIGLARGIHLPRGNPAKLPEIDPSIPLRLRLTLPEPVRVVS